MTSSVGLASGGSPKESDRYKLSLTKGTQPASKPDLDPQASEEFDDFLAKNPGQLYGAYVQYPSSFSHLQESIVEAIRDTITKQAARFTDECHYTSEFKGGTPARRDIHRILVAFDEEADQLAFKGLLRFVTRKGFGCMLPSARTEYHTRTS